MVQFSEKIENEHKQNTIVNINENDVISAIEDAALQEERRKTGKTLATGIVVFLVGLGLYHAIVYGSSRLSALVGGFIIMFLYVVSLLYASHKKKKLTKSNEAALEREIKEVIVKASKSAEKLQVEGETKNEEEQEKSEPAEPPDRRPRFVRIYSVG